jgi:recombination protein RecA
VAKEESPKKKVSSLADFNAKWKENVVDKVRKASTLGFWSTGSSEVDRISGGGFPQAELVQCYGPSKSGKSSLALRAISLRLKAKGNVAYFDLERGLDWSSEKAWLEIKNPNRVEDPNYDTRRKGWLRKNGVDPFSEQFAVYIPKDGEQMFSMIHEMLESCLFDLIVIDSLAAVLTRSQLAGEPGEASFGAVSKLLSVELSRLQWVFDHTPECLTSVVIINQIRDKIGYMSNGGTKAFGGKALEHYVGTSMKFTKIKNERKGDETVTETRVVMEKSRHATSEECRIYISSERGVDTMAELVDVGMRSGLIHAQGAWFYIFQEPISDEVFESTPTKKRTLLEGHLAKVNGRSNTLAWLSENGWQERLEALMQNSAENGDEDH